MDSALNNKVRFVEVVSHPGIPPGGVLSPVATPSESHHPGSGEDEGVC